MRSERWAVRGGAPVLMVGRLGWKPSPSVCVCRIFKLQHKSFAVTHSAFLQRKTSDVHVDRKNGIVVVFASTKLGVQRRHMKDSEQTVSTLCVRVYLYLLAHSVVLWKYGMCTCVWKLPRTPVLHHRVTFLLFDAGFLFFVTQKTLLWSLYSAFCLNLISCSRHNQPQLPWNFFTNSCIRPNSLVMIIHLIKTRKIFFSILVWT